MNHSSTGLKAQLQLMASVFFFAGLLLFIVVNDTPWIGTAIMAVGIAAALGSVFVVWRQRRAGG